MLRNKVTLGQTDRNSTDTSSVVMFQQTGRKGTILSNRHVCMVVKNRLSNDARVKKEIRALVEDGWRVTVIAMPERGYPQREIRGEVTILRPPIYSGRKQALREKIEGVSQKQDTSFRAGVLRCLRQNRIRRFFADLQRDIPWEMKLRRAAVAADADVYHANDLDTLEICGIAAKKNGAKLVYDSHELWLESSKFLYRTSVLSRFRLRLIEKRYIRMCDAVIAVTPMRAEKMKGLYGDLGKVDLLINCPEKLDIPSAKGDLRREIQAANDSVIVLYQGVFSAGRGLEELLEATKKIEDDRVKTVFIGMDSLNGHLQEMAEKLNLSGKVFFLPAVASEELARYTFDADIGMILFNKTCLNNFYSLPNKLFEYMMAGVAIVSSDFPELKSIIDITQCGITVDPTDPVKIAAAIRQLADNSSKREAMAMAGRKAALSKYNWDEQKQTLINIYRRLVSE